MFDGAFTVGQPISASKHHAKRHTRSACSRDRDRHEDRDCDDLAAHKPPPVVVPPKVPPVVVPPVVPPVIVPPIVPPAVVPPVITPPLPPATGTVFWKADATQPIDQQFASLHTTAHCAQPTTPGVTDPRLYQVSDPTAPHGRAYQADYVPSSQTGCYCYPNVCRDEAGMGNPGKTMPDGVDRLWRVGMDRWISFKLNVMDSNIKGAIIQFTHPVGNGAPAWGMSTGEKSCPSAWSFWGLTDVTGRNNASTDNCVGNYTNDIGKYVKFSVHIHFAMDSTGMFDVYSDSGNVGGPMALLFSRDNRFTMTHGAQQTATTAFLTYGRYINAGLNPLSGSVRMGGFTVASDRATAEANAFAP